MLCISSESVPKLRDYRRFRWSLAFEKRLEALYSKWGGPSLGSGRLAAVDDRENPRKKRRSGQHFLRRFFYLPLHTLRRPERGAKRRLKDLPVPRNDIWEINSSFRCFTVASQFIRNVGWYSKAGEKIRLPGKSQQSPHARWPIFYYQW